MMARAALVTLALAGCAGPDAPAPARTVPPGCDAAASRVEWSGYTKQPKLTSVRLYRGAAVTADPGTPVLEEPYVSAITGPTAPADWLARLATSLAAETGDEIHTEPAVLEDGVRWGSSGVLDDPSIEETLHYEGVQAVSAAFTVHCAPPVQGALTAWTTFSYGGVTCGQLEPPADELGRLARSYCPRTPVPGPPSPAIEAGVD
ncbi:hypothetical protein [Couchioplanes azureus]|uniref:hypothetical protein n=1 Tax=Couchioplanes caeruleus TaxID=56438 RepID=UPI0016700FE0|nr:hypothetical protein [Couchioplanes caeruleus]GGQ62845.1 hypothetical protein GCM10010166_35780 [Couchioplanes caeruleus subsp. azureus]